MRRAEWRETVTFRSVGGLGAVFVVDKARPSISHTARANGDGHIVKVKFSNNSTNRINRELRDNLILFAKVHPRSSDLKR